MHILEGFKFGDSSSSVVYGPLIPGSLEVTFFDSQYPLGVSYPITNHKPLFCTKETPFRALYLIHGGIISHKAYLLLVQRVPTWLKYNEIYICNTQTHTHMHNHIPIHSNAKHEYTIFI